MVSKPDGLGEPSECKTAAQIRSEVKTSNTIGWNFEWLGGETIVEGSVDLRDACQVKSP